MPLLKSSKVVDRGGPSAALRTAAPLFLFACAFIWMVSLLHENGGNTPTADDSQINTGVIAKHPPDNHNSRANRPPTASWELARDKLQAHAARISWRLSPKMLQGPADPAPKTGHKSEPPMVISEAAPRLVIFPGFLSSAERKHLMQLAQEAGLERSGVMDGEEDTARQDVRTSSGAWLEDLLDDGVFDIDLRIQAATGVPWMFGENMHVLRYQPGQKYEAHLDSCFMQDFPRDAVPDASDPQATGDGAFSAGCEAFLRQAGGPDCGPGGAGGPTCGDR